MQVVSTVDPFGYYNEGIQQRLDDAFVEGESSSQQAEPYSPSADELPPSVLSPTSPILAPKDTRTSNGSDSAAPQVLLLPSLTALLLLSFATMCLLWLL